MALVVTPGGATSNSYATLAEANAYHSDHLYASAWAAATDAAKTSGLIMAARLLDAMPRAWTGAATSSTQALGWPRTGMLSRNGFAIATAAIPTDLKNAQAEYARQLIEGNLTETDSVVAKGVKSLKAGPVSLTFKDSMEQRDALLAMIPDAVIALLVPSWLIDVADIDESRNGLVIEAL